MLGLSKIPVLGFAQTAVATGRQQLTSTVKDPCLQANTTAAQIFDKDVA